MNKGLIIAIISGLSTLFGLFFTINTKNSVKEDKIITISLSIAFFYMILISLFDLFPESLKNLSNKPFLDVFLYILVNYTIIQLILKISHKISKNKVEKGELYFLGLINMISLLLHNIPEGIIICISTNYNFNLGLRISLSIIMHNIPEGIAIATPIYYATKKRSVSLLFLVISSLGEILGAFISIFLFNNSINNELIGYILISISVLMITIAVEEIFFQIKDKNKKNIIIGLSIGLAIFLINILLIK